MAEPKRLSIIAQPSPITASNRSHGVRLIVKNYKTHQVMELTVDDAAELSNQIASALIIAKTNNAVRDLKSKRRAA